VSASVTTMMLTILASSLVLLATATEARPQEEWGLYKAVHGKEYSAEEDLMRFSIWLQNKEMVDAHNNADHGYKMALMEHSDWTEEEFNERRLGFIPSPYDPNVVLEYFEDVTAPTSLDHRDSGLVTPVKNQGQCGSCWAFSATGGLEGAWMKKTGDLISMSEQEMLDCGPGSCQGGMMGPAWDTVKKGEETEEDYPYHARDQKCQFDASKSVAKTTGWKNVGHTEAALEKALFEVGHPISIAVHVGSSFQHYSHGIYKDHLCRWGRLNHAVLAVGYNKDKDGEHYWIVKNSWGTGWGEDGYIRMEMGHNVCGLAKSGMYPLV